MVTKVILIVLCSLCLSLIESANSLKCRTGVQQANNQYQKIMHICKKRSTTDNDYSYDSSSEDRDSDDSSSVDLFGIRFFLNDDSKFSNVQSWKDSNENRNHGNNQRNGNDRRYSANYTNGNWRNIQYLSRGSNNRDHSYFDGAGRSSYDQMHNGNSANYDKQQEQVFPSYCRSYLYFIVKICFGLNILYACFMYRCIIQCFFNELNMVDQRGFPEQVSIIQFMTRNVHNPELQDFIEEAVIECFHYLDSDMRQNKCYFSENLLSCLVDKGKERCEDWDD